MACMPKVKVIDLNAQGHINQILVPKAVPFMTAHQVTLLQDNAWTHNARVTQQILQRNQV